MTQAISHDRPMAAYFMQIPNMADDDLDPFQFRLYAHYIRRAGSGGVCFESVRTTAQACRMSITKVIQAREWLAAHGWISADAGNGNGTLNVRILDRMPENVGRYSAKSDPNMDQSVAKSDPNMEQSDRGIDRSDPNMEQLAGASDPNMDQTDPNMDRSDPNMEPKNIPLRIPNKNIPEHDLDRQTDRDPQPAAAVCLSDDGHAQARQDVIRAFQAGGVLLPSTADPVIDGWIRAYPLPAVLWSIREAIAQRDGGRKINAWSSYVTKTLENKAAEGWPPAVVDELRRGGYALDVAQDVVAMDPVADVAQADPAQVGGWSPADVQADPAADAAGDSDLDTAWTQALAELDGRIPDVFRAALASCRLVDLNGRAVVRAHDAMAAQAVTRMGRQLEIVLGVKGVDLAPAA